MVDGLASVVTAKTTMTLAQVAFIFLGIAIGIGLLGTSASTDSPAVSLTAAIASVGLLLFGTVAFVLVQRRGLFMSALGMLRKCRIRIRFLEARESRLQELDRSILDFYVRDRWAFFLCFVTYFLGWLAEGLEVYAMLYFLGSPAALPVAISIAALSVFIKGGTFFIPGSLGAQDGGNLLLLLAFGFTEVAGITFALLRRVRELVWIVIGLVSLAAFGGRDRVDPAGLEAAQ